jgi:hypothetical protein
MARRRRALVATVAAAAALVAPRAEGRQQPIDPVDFKPFVDGAHWIVRQPLRYRIGISSEEIVVPIGFVTDFASIPPALQSIIRQNGPYILPAVVHDYLYWVQSCTRAQSDQIFLLAMLENSVGALHRVAIHGAVVAAGGFAWDQNTRERESGMLRTLPANRQQITAATFWPLYRQELAAEGVVEPPPPPIAPSFCARGDMTVEEALRRP